MKNTNQLLNKAKKAKNDEFYTMLSDIENECQHYTEQFRGKVIYCNCDDPEKSNFYKYFKEHFSEFGLKKLITSHYTSGSKSYMTEMTSNCEAVCMLQGDGDFRSQESLELLDEADIVVTNPPFSLFREYVKTLMDHNKKFLIIGNVISIAYKEFFPLIMNNEVWIGASIHSGDRAFNVPDDYPLNAAGCGIDENGRKFIRVKGVRWFTNLDIAQRHEEIIPVKKYNSDDYPKYDNCNAIDVSKTANIPYDYNGIMGVPITFMDKYNPDQFKIIKFRKGDDGKDLCIKGKCPYNRILIQYTDEWIQNHPENFN